MLKSQNCAKVGNENDGPREKLIKELNGKIYVLLTIMNKFKIFYRSFFRLGP